MLHPDNSGHSPEMIDKADLESRRVTKNIVLGKDGKYHWYYEFKLLKNPTILFLLWKMFFWIGIGIWLMSVLLMTFEGNFSRDFWSITKTFGIGIAGLEAFVALGYFLYAWMQGFKYCVLFEMGEEGVKHTQLQRQFKKARAMSLVLILAGLSAGKPDPVGAGLLAASRNSMFSSWSHAQHRDLPQTGRDQGERTAEQEPGLCRTRRLSVRRGLHQGSRARRMQNP